MGPLEIVGCVVCVAALCVTVMLLLGRLRGGGRGGDACGDGGSLRGRVAMVTGGNTGIGLEVARGLAARGAHVLLACRDVTRATAAVRHILASCPSASVRVVPLDLADLASVRACADSVARTEGRLDLLVNNAGVYGVGTDRLTGNGLVEAMQVNHFGPFLLTLLFLPLIRASADGRIVFVSSILHHLGTVAAPERLNEPGRYCALRTYANSKLCNVAVAAELERRGVCAYSVHPGVAVTRITRTTRLARAVLVVWAALCGCTVSAAALTVLHVSCVTPAPRPGYWASCRPARAAPSARSPAPRLWTLSERLVHYHPEQADTIACLAALRADAGQTVL